MRYEFGKLTTNGGIKYMATAGHESWIVGHDLDTPRISGLTSPVAREAIDLMLGLIRNSGTPWKAEGPFEVVALDVDDLQDRQLRRLGVLLPVATR